ncbi:(-)-germacrene D synthase-like isoform X1 [Malania oleifera]|uniref:(-)-germacrene D synthase-like isoform X1 n=1 Tax=Malania oleifera TaxID=397392 RepID=UPI0025AE348E|nr:(-)-germacrene D synthase-like isoform X1 [Malania oleifera]
MEIKQQPSLAVMNYSQQPAGSAVVRPLADFPPPSVWASRFISFSPDNSKREWYVRQIEGLKNEVRRMVMGSEANRVDKVKLINSLQRLGVSYHFEKEIEDQLQLIFAACTTTTAADHFNFNGDDLYNTSLLFRVLRQNGFNLSSNVFKKFKGSDGKFKEEVRKDVRGMLSLYEAAHLRIQGEDILEEAVGFASGHLEECVKSGVLAGQPQLEKQVKHALERPLHKTIQRLEASHFISLYRQDESRNETLLKFAVLDFNLLQLQHQEELCHISKWWEDLKFSKKLPYARNRVVECYFWAVGAYYEPHFSLARLILTKAIAFASILDDTYDAYGTIDELQLYTHAIQRWDVGAIDGLPDYMKVSYRDFLNLYKEFEEEMAKEERSYNVHHTIEAFKEVARGYYLEAKWMNEKYVPTFEEYMGNALTTTAYHMLITASFIGMGELATKAIFHWINTKPKIVTASKIICRLMDDIVSHHFEQERGHVASAIECYMKQYGVSEEEVKVEFQKRISNAWKDANEECLRATAVPRPFIARILNLSRSIDVIYRYDDGYTNAKRVLKDYIESLFIHPVPI